MESSDSSSAATAVSTLFVADVPSHLQERDFISLFSSSDGFLGARLRNDRNDNVVGFVDFDDHDSAARALERFQDYKFGELADEGISIHFSSSATRKPRSPRDNGNSGSKNNNRRSRSPRRNVSKLPMANHLPVMMPDMSFYSTLHNPSFAAYNNVAFPPLPSKACQTLYVEGLPLDATEREVAHIFRPWAGFQSLRILPKESKQYPNKMYNLCFVEFDNKYQSTIAMNALQGYKMDKNDNRGLSISYAKTERKENNKRTTKTSPKAAQFNASQERSQSSSGPVTPQT